MHKTIGFVVAIILVCTWQATACAQELWQNTIVGMSVAEAQRLYPDYTHFKGQGTGKESLVGGPITMFGAEFMVHFQFENQKLIQVSLGSADNVPGQMPDPSQTHRQIADGLRKRYGPSTKVEDKYAIDRQLFSKDGVNITLTLAQHGPYTSLNITYQPIKPAEAPL